MSSTPGVSLAMRLACLRSMAQDDIWIALYTPKASLTQYTAAYTPEGEVVGEGYERGGKRMEGINFGVAGSRAYVDWSVDPRWEPATISAQSAMIYNRSKNDMAVCVIVFNEVITSKNAPWWLELPPPGDTAIIRWA